MQNSSTWCHISIGNGTYITTKHAIAHIEIEIAQLKLDIGMTKKCSQGWGKHLSDYYRGSITFHNGCPGGQFYPKYI